MNEDIECIVGTALKDLQNAGMEGTLQAISKANAFTTAVRDGKEDYVLVDFRTPMEFEDRQKYIDHTTCLYLEAMGWNCYDC